ncbi:phosphorylase / glycogen(starch) synthase [Chitinophaga sp. YR627]|uniref:alpha-glucan family phosphorylase n=1 Tax=Chitinophaga sp. YR627 TaxID=1881041 RepID=UPI0008F0C15A|nr:alpha-glucan family phosphorylase [Chitinophaga sp. YR627]SFM71270.1 phosphorylase / glycogen(starch) synthase [Chitinophaga sp. YR627]
MEPFTNGHLTPDYLFEVSWEVCNKVGGIHTVVSTKAGLLQEKLKERLIMIGPDIVKASGGVPVFQEDRTLFPLLQEKATAAGLKIRTGHWNIAGAPQVILIDFTTLYKNKNDIFTTLWRDFRLDSLSGQWDYIDPALFGYAAGLIIQFFYELHLNANEHIIAQFHEWMTGAGILYLEKHVPQVATVLTTHATVLGRTLSGAGQPVYNCSAPLADAARYGITSKHSLETIAASTADCFTCVSETTANECRLLLHKNPDYLTPNGFDLSIVPKKDFSEKRTTARNVLLRIASQLIQETLPPETILILKSGRYEFHNKGIDVFLDALGILNHQSFSTPVVVFIFVPAAHTGPKHKSLISGDQVLTHNLYTAAKDPIFIKLHEKQLDNTARANVKVVYAPVYLDGNDGVFNLDYYSLLPGFDLGIFPSWYEPWGYTPLESSAFYIPSMTTSQSGFGQAVSTLPADNRKGITILNRCENDDPGTAPDIAAFIHSIITLSSEKIASLRENAHAAAAHFSWKVLLPKYYDAYNFALHRSRQREDLYCDKPQAQPVLTGTPEKDKVVWREVYIATNFPAQLEPLKRLSRNIWWSWHPDAAALFRSIDPVSWDEVNENPVRLLNNLRYEQLEMLSRNNRFLAAMQLQEETLDEYLHMTSENTPAIAYFCMEYALLGALRIYSGGLGVLAGDFLKTASDSGMNCVAIGLFYKQGYFHQHFSDDGRQIAVPEQLDPSDFPMEKVSGCNGERLLIPFTFPGRTVHAEVWKIQVGRVPLYLLDTDIADNTTADRLITSRLYPSDRETRLQQEIILGQGGVRLLNALQVTTDVYHCNEGHAAFLSIERIAQLILHNHLSFDDALEVVRASLLFTTHTSAPAAMDSFNEHLLRTYFSGLTVSSCISWEEFMSLGKRQSSQMQEEFSMFYLAAHTAGEINAVSRIHQAVSASLLQKIWDEYYPAEIPVSYITNGVHLSTWLAPEWKNVFQECNINISQGNGYWQHFQTISDAKIWLTRTQIKKKFLEKLKQIIVRQLRQHHTATEKITEMMRVLQPDTMFIGFARRFTPYKRSTILFYDHTELEKITGNLHQPVVFLISGKAHPDDQAGTNMLQEIIGHTYDHRIIFLEDYDLDIARLMVQGCDLWLNFPVRGKEACGTSGMKALLNGVLQFSTPDGWWAEQYHPETGWALKAGPMYQEESKQFEVDAAEVYSMLQHEIIPLFFDRNEQGLPHGWIQKIRNALSVSGEAVCMTNALQQYIESYKKLADRTYMLSTGDFAAAKALTAWKEKIRKGWESVKIRNALPRNDQTPAAVTGDELNVSLDVDTGTLTADDIGAEILFTPKHGGKETFFKKELLVSQQHGNKLLLTASVPLKYNGDYNYSFRVYPRNFTLTHRTDIVRLKPA